MEQLTKQLEQAYKLAVHKNPQYLSVHRLPFWKKMLLQGKEHKKNLAKLEAMERNLLEVSSVPKEERNRWMDLLGCYERDLNAVESINVLEGMRENVKQIQRSGILEATGIPRDLIENTFRIEFHLYNIHVWMYMLKVNSRKSVFNKGNFRELFMEAFYNIIILLAYKHDPDHWRHDNFGKAQKELSQTMLNVFQRFDQALVLAEESDVMLAEVIWITLYEQRPECLDAKNLYFWTRWIRFQLSYMDHLNTTLIDKGFFHWYLPTDPLITYFDQTPEDSEIDSKFLEMIRNKASGPKLPNLNQSNNPLQDLMKKYKNPDTL